MTTSGYTSKTAFKSKLGAKKSFKVKFWNNCYAVNIKIIIIFKVKFL